MHTAKEGTLTMETIILASQSPRRKELLAHYGLPFVVDPSQTDEDNVTGTGAERAASEKVRKAYLGC